MNPETACPQLEVEVCEESCPVCLETLTPESTFVIKGCNHSVCNGCATQCRSTGYRVYDPYLDITLIKCPLCRSTEALTEAQKAESARLKQSGQEARLAMLRNAANTVATIFKLDVNLRFIPKGPQNVGMPYIVIPMAPPEERVPKETPARAMCGCRGRFKEQQVNCTHKRCACGRPVCNFCFHCSNCQRHFEYLDALQDRYDLPFEILPPSSTN